MPPCPTSSGPHALMHIVYQGFYRIPILNRVCSVYFVHTENLTLQTKN